jgi:hypothetical protein
MINWRAAHGENLTEGWPENQRNDAGKIILAETAWLGGAHGVTQAPFFVVRRK